MSLSSVIAEATKRLEHLRRLPETPFRAREIASLERVLAGGATKDEPVRAPRKKVAITNKKPRQPPSEERVAAEPERPSAPQRKVEFEDGRRRVIIRKAQPQQASEVDEDEEIKRECKQRMSDIQSTLKLKYRGFS